MRKILLLLDFSRSRSAFLSLGEPALGALLALGAIPSARVILLGLLASVAGYLCVYALNDLLDVRSDREEIHISQTHPQDWDPEVPHVDILTLRHPVAAGALPLWAGVAWVSVFGVVGLVAAYLLRPVCAVLFVVCALLEVVYCSLRRRTWLKVIPAGVMVATGGLAGWFAVGAPGWGALIFFFLLFFWEVFGRNLSNDLADVEHDRTLGIATLAAARGPAVAVAAIITGAIAMPVVALLQTGTWQIRVILAALAVVTMTVPALLLKREPGKGTAQRYFNRASLFPSLASCCLIVLYVVTG